MTTLDPERISVQVKIRIPEVHKGKESGWEDGEMSLAEAIRNHERVILVNAGPELVGKWTRGIELREAELALRNPNGQGPVRSRYSVELKAHDYNLDPRYTG